MILRNPTRETSWTHQNTQEKKAQEGKWKKVTWGGDRRRGVDGGK